MGMNAIESTASLRRSPVSSFDAARSLSAGSAAGVTCRISESDLLICAAGFQQSAPPILERGEQITQLTSDGNWRCSVASATGLREAACAWSAITGGAVMIGVVLSAKWHHETN